MIDLFSDQKENDDFMWVVGVFANGGAIDAIRRTNEVALKTYFPIKFNGRQEPVPLWRNYLFIEFREFITLQICHSTSKFIKVLSMRDDDDQLRPVLVRKSAIDENQSMVLFGKFNDISYKRKFYGKGSIVRVIEGHFMNKLVVLEVDILPELNGRTMIPVHLNQIKAKIELSKLAL
jgi:hypothetical protein